MLKDAADEYGVLRDALRHQQEAFWNAKAKGLWVLALLLRLHII